MTLLRPPLSTPERLQIILSVLADKKADKVTLLDLRQVSYLLCDYFVIATAESDRQSQAIVDSIVEKLKQVEGSGTSYRIEGYEVGRWILLDLGDVVVHMLLPEVREYYKLEELWGDAIVVSHA
ncbi:MAG: ribosome silencing factor [Bacteroidia bacterium]|nr:ribosome silencing factor [Bacteroidia bacterium]